MFSEWTASTMRRLGGINYAAVGNSYFVTKVFWWVRNPLPFVALPAADGVLPRVVFGLAGHETRVGMSFRSCVRGFAAAVGPRPLRRLTPPLAIRMIYAVLWPGR